MVEDALPISLTLDQAFRAAYFLADQYIALEEDPDDGLVLFGQYLRSDPARRNDWKTAVNRALAVDPTSGPLVENLFRPD